MKGIGKNEQHGMFGAASGSIRAKKHRFLREKRLSHFSSREKGSKTSLSAGGKYFNSAIILEKTRRFRELQSIIAKTSPPALLPKGEGGNLHKSR
jgi:hypothetical protein